MKKKTDWKCININQCCGNMMAEYKSSPIKIKPKNLLVGIYETPLSSYSSEKCVKLKTLFPLCLAWLAMYNSLTEHLYLKGI